LTETADTNRANTRIEG